MIRRAYDVYRTKPRTMIYCRTKTSIVHTRLEKFFARHVKYDYSENNYVYIITRITNPLSENEYVEIIYTQFSCIYDSPTKEIAIHKANKVITIVDNFSEHQYRRYQCFVQQ